MAAAVKGKKERSADERVLEAIFNPEDPLGGDVGSSEEENVEEVGDESEAVKAAKALEVEAVREAEQGRLAQALSLLTEAVTMAPECPSPYNNRAQVYRLQNQVELALADLNMAVQLSGGRGKAAQQALTQRGLIHRLHGNNEEAKSDFQTAAKLGSKFAQKQLVQMNPYAALCGQMLTEAFEKIRKGEQT